MADRAQRIFFNGGILTPQRVTQSLSETAQRINRSIIPETARWRGSIELLNTTGEPIDIGGWYLSDSSGNYQKFQIPDGTVLSPGGYLVFDERDFHPNGPWNPEATEPGEDEFALNGAHGDCAHGDCAHRDDAWLLQSDAAGNPTRFVDHVEFDAARGGESFGRWPDDDGRLVPMQKVTLGRENSGPRVGPVMIGEVMYYPPETAGADPDDLEFVEITNPFGELIDLTDWRIRGGLDFDFPADTILPARSSPVVVSFDPDVPANSEKLDAFRACYGITPSVVIVGGYSGRLDDDGERVQLQRPDTPPLDEPDFTPYLLEDEVRFYAVAPWPTEPAGTGKSLTRAEVFLWGNDATSWITTPPSPGSTVLYVHPGDANLDDVTDVRDFMIWNVHKFTSASAPAPVLIQAVDDVFNTEGILPTGLAWLSEWLDSASVQDDDVIARGDLLEEFLAAGSTGELVLPGRDGRVAEDRAPDQVGMFLHQFLAVLAAFYHGRRGMKISARPRRPAFRRSRRGSAGAIPR